MMRSFVSFVFWVLVIACALVVWAAPSFASSMTPEALRGIFDANAIAIMFVWGLVHKYVPALEKLENNLIPWASAIGYVLAKLFPALLASPAHASVAGAVSAVPDAGAVILAGATNSVVAALLYDKFGRVVLDRWLRKLFRLPAASA